MDITTPDPHSKKLWYLKNMNVFAGLPWRELRELERITRMVKYRKSDPVYVPGEPSDVVYLLKKGRVKISRLSEDGREVTLAILDAGEIFGEVEALDAVPRESMVQALEPVTICEISREDFCRYLHTYPEVGGRVFKLTRGRLRQIETRVSDLVFKSAPARLARLLLTLCETMGERVADEEDVIQLQVRLSHQNLANLIGTSRETVSSLIGQFARHGLLRQQNRYIFILDRERLSRVK